MRTTTTTGRENDRFTASLHTPAGQYADQQPTLQLANSDLRFVAFLNIDEARRLIDVLTANVDGLQRADDQWQLARDIDAPPTTDIDLPLGSHAEVNA